MLTTLGERLPSGLADHMAAQLPPEPEDSIRQATDSSAEGPAVLSTERFGMARGTRRRARSGTHGERGRGTRRHPRTDAYGPRRRRFGLTRNYGAEITQPHPDSHGR
ncbi:hypothetical protein [Streptomyces phaeochromogenes]|uniref:hypothetical protein n=1 Tax=Streptomyces phaeochromogenes TaxID=1923 RepID=UPI0027D85B55|nr:hypothetical protein [Streptomyces phaeochromogenes]